MVPRKAITTTRPWNEHVGMDSRTRCHRLHRDDGLA